MGYPRVPNRHAKQTAFLTQLARGRSLEEAAAHAGVPLPTFYTWRRKHTRFREAWKAAIAYGRTPSFASPAVLVREAERQERAAEDKVIVELRDLDAEEAEEEARATAPSHTQ